MEATKRARIRYLRPEWRSRSDRPWIGSRESRRAHTEFYDVEISDARPLQERGELDLDHNGFVLAKHRSRVSDFHDPEQVRRSYYPELEALLQRLTGAEWVVFLHHLIRTESSKSFNDAYARYVHCDFSEASAREMSRKLLVERSICAPDDTERYDFAWYNTWQPIEREVRQNALTLVDAATVDPQDVVEYTFGGSSSDGVALMPFYSSKHRHYYFPRMQTDEVIVFKQLDSRPDRSRFCPHTSFDDLTAPQDAIRRRSIEVRMMAVFPRTV